MQKYKADQTGPKIQFGGFQLGFARVAYQVAIFGVVTAPPIPAAAKQTTRKMTRPIQGYLAVMEAPGPAGMRLKKQLIDETVRKNRIEPPTIVIIVNSAQGGSDSGRS